MIMQDGIVRALKAISPAWLAPDVNFVAIGVDLNNYATNTALATKQNTLTAGTGMVFHEKLLEGTKVKSLVAGNNITLTSTEEFVNINLSSGLVLNDVSVQNLFALAPIVSVYGTIQLGTWRLKGSESNNFVLERFDNDGEIASIAWIPVAEFSFNTDTNTSVLQLSNLGVTNSLSAGSMTSGGFPVITTSTGYTKAQVDTQFSNLIDNAPNALNTLKELANAIGNDPSYATTIQNQLATKANQTTTYTKTEVDTQFSNLIDSAPTALNTLKELANALANDANYATTVQNQLALKANQSTTYTKTEVDSSLNQKQDALLISTPSGGSSLITNSGVVKGLKTNSPITLTDASNVLTIGLNTTTLSNEFALKFTPAQPLIEDYNVLTNVRTLMIDPLGTMSINDVETNNIYSNGASQVTVNDNLVVTGNLTVNGSLINYKPFWAAGRVNGTNLSILKSNGRYGFTVTRAPDFPTGVYKITFNTAAPDANYVISLAQFGNGNVKVWENTLYSGLPTASAFHVVTYNTSWVVANYDFYFSVYV
jgi:hypothetical protein